ncbi:MAG: hypothetical protein ABJN84_01870 [Flavobacteriaceae bacterium]
MEVLEVAQKEMLYKSLLLQLKKDFELANVKLSFSMEADPKEFKDILKEKIYVLLLENIPEYQNLLYVVDIPEYKITKLKSLDVVDVSEEVCFLLLKREWQKVWFKWGHNL